MYPIFLCVYVALPWHVRSIIRRQNKADAIIIKLSPLLSFVRMIVSGGYFRRPSPSGDSGTEEKLFFYAPGALRMELWHGMITDRKD